MTVKVQGSSFGQNVGFWCFHRGRRGFQIEEPSCIHSRVLGTCRDSMLCQGLAFRA